jgi:S-adenosylmethionine/arginine decarboxylase-like enzyme
VLAESHLALHTWPEHAIASMDVFVCSPKTDPHRARTALAQSLLATRTSAMELSRGTLNHERPTRKRRARPAPSR